MSTVDQTVRKLERTGRNIATATRTGVNEAGLLAANSIRVSGRAATGGDLILSGTTRRRAGKPMTVVALPAKATVNATALIVGRPAGLWSIIESGASAHVVGGQRGATSIGTNKFGVKFSARQTKAGKTRRSFTAKLLANKASGFAAWGPFTVPGSPAKHAFSNGVNAILPAVPKIIRRATNAAIAESFR